MFVINHFTSVYDFFWGVIIAASRIYGAMIICPVFSSNYLTKMLKICLAFIFGIMVLPYVEHQLILPVSTIARLFFIVKELIIGFMVGYALAFPFWLVETIGNIIDRQRGEQMGSVINPLTNSSTSSIGKMLIQAFTAYFVVANGFIFIFSILFNSFMVLPIAEFDYFSHFQNTDVYIGLFSTYFNYAVLLTMPIIGVMLLLELVLGLISSFIPQLNVTVISMPLKTAAGMFILILYISILYHNILDKFTMGIRGIYG